MRLTVVSVDREAAMIEVDLADNPDCQPCGLNLTEATAASAAMVAVFNSLVDHGVPANAGSFRRVRIRLRENCCVGIPVHPFSCSVATTNLADRVSNPVQRAFAELADGFGQAEVGPIMPPGASVISGSDPRAGGAPFVNQIMLALTIVHILIDAKLWRLREPLQRGIIRERFDFVFQG